MYAIPVFPSVTEGLGSGLSTGLTAEAGDQGVTEPILCPFNKGGVGILPCTFRLHSVPSWEACTHKGLKRLSCMTIRRLRQLGESRVEARTGSN